MQSPCEAGDVRDTGMYPPGTTEEKCLFATHTEAVWTEALHITVVQLYQQGLLFPND